MNSYSTKYTRFALCNEMMETIEIIKNFNSEISKQFVQLLQKKKSVLITGEGSSRIFPGKNFKDISLRAGCDYNIVVEGATQSLEYSLENQCVFGVSNSGKTKELINLFNRLARNEHSSFYSLTATPLSLVTQLAISSVVLSCGKEEAVAATKSVIEQALFFESLYYNYCNKPMPSLNDLAKDLKFSLEMPVHIDLVKILSEAPVIYFAGRNNGVAEELALKTNEITRKKSVFLEGTYALHGIEEVMQRGEVLIVIDPFEYEAQKFYEVINKGAGVQVIAISPNQTIFPTILIPNNQAYLNYLELATGWNLLVEVGLFLGIDLDKPVRARKIGNEV